jgi:8-oxo-dGTP pyrophosphatase MutT (NUDIX family)
MRSHLALSPDVYTPNHQSMDSACVELDKGVVFSTPYQQVRLVTVSRDNFSKDIYVNEFGRRSGVLFVRDDEVLLVRQHRLLDPDMSLEIPGGKIDDNETPEEGARRESEEETGLTARSMHPLVYFMPGLDTCNNPTQVFWCNDFEDRSSSGHDRVPHEIVDHLWLPLQECLNLVFARRILDSMTITALLAWQVMRLHVDFSPENDS